MLEILNQMWWNDCSTRINIIKIFIVHLSDKILFAMFVRVYCLDFQLWLIFNVTCTLCRLVFDMILSDYSIVKYNPFFIIHCYNAVPCFTCKWTWTDLPMIFWLDRLSLYITSIYPNNLRHVWHALFRISSFQVL